MSHGIQLCAETKCITLKKMQFYIDLKSKG